MKKTLSLMAVVLLFAVCVPSVFAQEKPKDQEQRPEEYRFTLASLKVQVVFTEYEGDKKLKSLPYSLLITTKTRDDRPEAKIRVGNRIPVYIGGAPGGSQTVPSQAYTYMDVGTNIDGWAEGVGPGQYRVHLYLERSWVEGNVSVPIEKAASTQTVAGSSRAPEFPQPIIRQYKAELTPILKDGQSLETNFATDPLTGRVVKLEISISVLK